MGQVRVSRLEQLGDELDDLVDRFGRAGLGDRRPHLERGHVVVETRHLGVRELEVGNPELAGLGQYGVVDVGDVAHDPHFVAELLEPADQHVVGEVGRGVAEVRRVVRRDAAHVHTHSRRRFERHDGPMGSLVQPHHHGVTLLGPRLAEARYVEDPAGEIGVDLRGECRDRRDHRVGCRPARSSRSPRRARVSPSRSSPRRAAAR